MADDEIGKVPDPVTLMSVQLIYRNFRGEALPFNAKGDRNFNVILDEKTAKAMEKAGWNVKWQEPREEGEPKRPVIKVIVKYRKRDGSPTRPPRIILITSKGKTALTEDMIELLDWANLLGSDLTISPYPYVAPDGRTGISAYLQALYVTIREDPLEMKYLDLPDTGSAISALPVDPDLEGAPF